MRRARIKIKTDAVDGRWAGGVKPPYLKSEGRTEVAHLRDLPGGVTARGEPAMRSTVLRPKVRPKASMRRD